MGWEKRGRGRYYYRKRREGRRVIAQYLGTGELAEVLAEADHALAQERDRERELQRAQRQELRELDAKIDEAGEVLRLLTRAVLVSWGYHTHKGTWRKRRDGRQDKG